TYPHEWAASMLKDAALLHVQLFLDLGARGLTLKDWHPYNILFEGTTPRFIDFTSIIPIEELPSQAYLKKAAPAPRQAWRWDAIALAMYRMYRITCEPYFIIPMMMMQRGRHAVARQRLIETALNSGNSAITRGEAFAGSPLARLRYEV